MKQKEKTISDTFKALADDYSNSYTKPLGHGDYIKCLI